uniref:Uncharacterized protein n=1 Tax=Arundo donax TaxID=35708 RepID=A0A0A9H532_ARUDO
MSDLLDGIFNMHCTSYMNQLSHTSTQVWCLWRRTCQDVESLILR